MTTIERSDRGRAGRSGSTSIAWITAPAKLPGVGIDAVVFAFWRQVILDLLSGARTAKESGYPTTREWLESEAFVVWVEATMPGIDPTTVRASLLEQYGAAA